ncbi:MAG TPA: Holliday junction resolvase RuvX [Opitutaceae bacterium]|mgnify:CR=1 FL=1|jgi:putative Holliday junction resolvase|nr:Holliday junction resolvase RuvX [Opitutaceae bacterium]HRE05347.1 Holliday junction resolvase RuvX [Opitutaceae bacterium]
MRCLGIDYGTKRVGLSYGDEIGVATPLPALLGLTESERMEALATLIQKRRITTLVVGWPLNMDDSAGPKAIEAQRFAERLHQRFSLPVHLVDERLTSSEAESTIPKQNRRDLRASGRVDSRAATLILQDYLNQHLDLPPVVEDI